MVQKALDHDLAKNFWAREWLTRGYMDRALRPCFQVGEAWKLKTHDHAWKLKVFYQCVKDTQFREWDEQKAANTSWSTAVKPLRAQISHEVSDSQKLLGTFLRQKFAIPNAIWSMPASFLQPEMGPPIALRQLCRGVAEVVEESKTFKDSIGDDLVHFTVSQANTTQRKIVVAPYLERCLTKLEVVFLDVRSMQGWDEWTLSSRVVPTELDLMTLATPSRLSSIVAWCKASRS